MKRYLSTTFLIVLFSLAVSGQNNHELSLSLNYALVPHNSQQGSGYTVNYNQQVRGRFWMYNQLAFSQAMRIKGETARIGVFEANPLAYSISGYYYSLVPTFKFGLSERIFVNMGAGISAAYQTWLYQTYSYTIPLGFNYEGERTGINTNGGLRIGGVACFQFGVKLNHRWAIQLEGSYRDYFKGEEVISVGLGLGYSF